MPISPRASPIGLPALRASSTREVLGPLLERVSQLRSSADRSAGSTARHAGNASRAAATAASVSSTPARGTSAITCSVAGSTTEITRARPPAP